MTQPECIRALISNTFDKFNCGNYVAENHFGTPRKLYEHCESAFESYKPWFIREAEMKKEHL